MEINVEYPIENVEAAYSASERSSFFNSERMLSPNSFKNNNRHSGTGKAFYDQVWGIPSTEKNCCVCKGSNTPAHSEKRRCRIPRAALEHFWVINNIWLPANNRCCPHHIIEGRFTEEAVKTLRGHSKKGAWLSKLEIQEWLSHYQMKAHENRVDVDSSNMQDEDYELLFGVNKTNFDDLFASIKENLRWTIHRSPRNALAIFLIKLRLDLSQRMIGYLFGLPQPKVSTTIKRVAKLLDENFVPLNLGYKHLSRDEFLKSQDSEFARRLLRVPPGSIILVLDGTYIYTQKSVDHYVQKKTFSMQKGRNLLKVMMVVTATGYIVDVFGK